MKGDVIVLRIYVLEDYIKFHHHR